MLLFFRYRGSKLSVVSMLFKLIQSMKGDGSGQGQGQGHPLR
jgi:hypothetical protein